MKPETAADMLDMLYRLLPFIEDIEADTAYKPGIVRQLRSEMLALIAKAEGRPPLTVRARGKTFDNLADAMLHATGDQKFAESFRKK